MKFTPYASILYGMFLCATIAPASCANDLPTIEQLADKGDAKAQYEWGMLLIDGDKVKQDTITGRKWIEKAAEQDYTDAQTQLGKMCISGQGIPATVSYDAARDYQSAKKWLEKAAAKGDKKADYYLASLYNDGNGVQRDATKAFEYYKKSADKGYDQAQSIIGNFYYFGMKPIKQDYAKAKEWFEKSAAQGNGSAKDKLAGMYRFGMDVPVDTKKSLSMYKSLCQQGQETACYTAKDIEKTEK